MGEGGGHGPQISNGAAHLGLGKAQAEPIVGFQQNALRLHQPLAQGPVGGLPEVAAFGVLQMGPASSQSNFHIGDGRAGEHAQVGLFLEMGENQPLPGSLQNVLAALAVKDQTTARRQGLQEQVDLGVVA